MMAKVFIFLFACCIINMSVAFRTPREALTEIEPTSEEAGVFITNLLEKALDQTVPNYRINAISKIITEMMASKTSSEENENGMKFLKLLIDCALADKDISFTSDQRQELDKVLANISSYSGEDSNEISEKDVTYIRGELSKVLPTNVTELVTNTLSALKKGSSSAELAEGTINWLGIIVNGTRKRYGSYIAEV